MNKLNSYYDCNDLIKKLNKFYKLNFEEIYLHRDMIGRVYFVKNSMKKYVLKIYRQFNTEQALQSIDVIQFLRKNDYPVVSIIPTEEGSLYIKLNIPEGQCIGILYDFIEGIEPNFSTEIINVGQQIGELHNLMIKYPNPLIKRGKDFFIDRFIVILQKLQYCSKKVKELEKYGEEIWSNIKRLPTGFCHGDLHSGNMLQTKLNQYILFDFDIVSHAYSIIDVATLSNCTDFNQLDESTYDSTTRMFERFYQGYSKKRTLSDIEIAAIFDFIAVRHYELIATITDCQGLNCLSQSFLDEQFEWLMKWRTICNRKKI